MVTPELYYKVLNIKNINALNLIKYNMNQITTIKKNIKREENEVICENNNMKCYTQRYDPKTKKYEQMAVVELKELTNEMIGDSYNCTLFNELNKKQNFGEHKKFKDITLNLEGYYTNPKYLKDGKSMPIAKGAILYALRKVLIENKKNKKYILVYPAGGYKLIKLYANLGFRSAGKCNFTYYENKTSIQESKARILMIGEIDNILEQIETQIKKTI